MTDNNINQLENETSRRWLWLLVAASIVIIAVTWISLAKTKADKMQAVAQCQEQAALAKKAYLGTCLRCLEDHNIIDGEAYCQPNP